jgi:hypothetical protein
MSGQMMIDENLMKMLAESMARTAAQEVMIEMREEIAGQFENMKSEMRADLNQKFSNYFGKLDTDEHIIHHNRLQRIITWYDSFEDGVRTKLATAALVMVVAALLGVMALGWFVPKLFGN